MANPKNRTEMLTMLAPPDQTMRRMAAWSCLALVTMTVMWTGMCAGLVLFTPFLVDPLVAIVSAVAAVALGLPYLLIILWLDRNEPEPPWLLASAIGWGAVVATMISLIGNMTFQSIVTALGVDVALASQLTASFSAPFVEELSKAAALVALYVMFRHHLDNVLDGVIYGALVGWGFAVFENFVYYTNQGSMEGALALICLRGVITSAGTHACFTAIAGAGFGFMRVSRTGLVRWLFPIGGVALAMFVHFSWNTFTLLFTSGDQILDVLVGIPLAVIVLQLPFVLLVLTVAAFALRHERRIIELFLSVEKAPVVHENEVAYLVPARNRTLHELFLLLRGNFSGWWLVRKRNRRLVELAFEKWHMEREAAVGADQARVHALRVTELRKQLSALPAPPA